MPDGTGKFEVISTNRGTKTPWRSIPAARSTTSSTLPTPPSDGLALVKGAIAKVSTATGLKVRLQRRDLRASSKEREPYLPKEYSDRRWAPVLIVWTDEASYSELAGYIAGVGSPQAVYAPNNQLVYVTGQVVLDNEQLSTQQVPDRDEAAR